MRNKRGQVWIETVLYTLIGITLIGLVLSFVMPKINESKDRTVVQQSLDSLNSFDEKINSAAQTPGNVRSLQLNLKRGYLVIDGNSDTIYMVVDDLTKPYSEPGKVIQNGGIDMLTTKNAKTSSVSLTLNYSNKINITYQGSSQSMKFNPAPTAYSFSIKSLTPSNGMDNIEISEISG